MTNKEKEKAYDEALERAKKYYSTTNSAADTELIELIFPELKGSDDEKVRKALIDYFKRYDMCWTETFNGVPTDKILAWLEKQSKQKPILDFKASDWYVSKVDGKIHNIYHSVDKVKPKFKVGDWITNGLCTWRINSIDNEMYYQDGVNQGSYFENIDKEYRLWTIQDAKEGDVLFSFMKEKLWIYKNNKECHLAINPFHSNIMRYVDYDTIPDTKPATKEQCDFLFKETRKFGYEWDAEKKELRKIEQKPAIIDIDEMVDDYTNNKERGNEEFGKPVPCMIRAYRQGLNDAIRKVVERIKGAINSNKK